MIPIIVYGLLGTRIFSIRLQQVYIPGHLVEILSLFRTGNYDRDGVDVNRNTVLLFDYGADLL